MTNLDCLLKSRDITLPTKVLLVKAMVFPILMYGCESWTINKTEHWIDAFELRCWRRFLRVPLTARRSNQPILKEVNSEYTLEGLMLHYFGYLMWIADSLEDPDTGKDWRQKAKSVAEDEIIGYNHWFNGHELGQILGDREGQGGLECCSPWCRKKPDMIWWLNNKYARNFMPYTIHSTKAWWIKAFVRFTRKFGWETQNYFAIHFSPTATESSKKNTGNKLLLTN